MLEVETSGGDRLELAVRRAVAVAEIEVQVVGAFCHVLAAVEVEVLEVRASGGVRPEPAVRRLYAVGEVDWGGGGEPVHQPGEPGDCQGAAVVATAHARSMSGAASGAGALPLRVDFWAGVSLLHTVR